jgi:hypothetical protein
MQVDLSQYNDLEVLQMVAIGVITSQEAMDYYRSKHETGIIETLPESI